MTGTTAVQTRRNTTPSYGRNMNRRYSSDDEEPWDQRYSKSDGSDNSEEGQRQAAPMMRNNYSDDDDLANDGELPTLTARRGGGPPPKQQQQQRMGGRIIGGQRTTTRPLSPPSQAGLQNPNKQEAVKQRNFWGQLDTNDSNEERESLSEEGPDDEMAARREGRRQHREMVNALRQGDETDEDYSSSSYALGVSKTFSTVESLDEQDSGAFCEQTLIAIGEMCGGGVAHVKDSPENEPRDSRRVKVLTGGTVPTSTDQQEEHTAIEVEFVEPQSKKPSPDSKNAYLNALAKKAREDFEQSKEKVEPEEEESSSKPELTTTANRDVADNDFYTNFSASEKRKFLKLINSGLSPADASEHVVEERKKKEKPKEKEETKKAIRPRLAFWKKSPPPDHEKKDAAKDATQDVSLDVAEKEPEKEPAKEPEKEPAKEHEKEPEKVQEKGPEKIQVEKPEEDEEGKETLSKTASNPDNVSTDKKKNEVVDVTLPESDSDESPQFAFAKSGINYYDAVRRSDPDDISEEALLPVSPKGSSGTGRPHGKATFPKAKGFTKLQERRAQSAPRSRGSDAGESHLLPPRPHKTSDVESPFAGTLAVPGSEPMPRQTLESLLERSRSDDSSQDADAMEKIERELLRPIPNGELPKSGAPFVTPDRPSEMALKDRSKNGVTDAGLSPIPVVSPASSTSKPRKSGRYQIDTLDVDMNAYFSSTDAYSTVSNGGPIDSMSVFSGATGVTGVSAYTQSSRVRRPGAAKDRLAKAKQMEKASSKKGWHESIRAAAVSTNRVWDPKKGWIDFEETNLSAAEQPSDEKIHLDLHLKKRAVAEEEIDKGEAVPVPFPPEWEQERKRMIESNMDTDTAARAVKKPADGRNDASFTSFSSSPKKPTGWVESMRAASASIAKDGQSWDPKNGWTTIGDKKVPDVVDFDSESGATKDAGLSAHVVKTSDRARSIPLPPRPRDKKLNQWIEKVEHEPASRSERSAESSDKAVASAGGSESEKYMQLGDNGSVRSFAKDVNASRKSNEPGRTTSASSTLAKPPSAAIATATTTATVENVSDEDTVEAGQAPLLNDDSGSFPSMNMMDETPLSPVTDVVKEKIDAEDMTLFHHEDTNEVGTPALAAETAPKAPHRGILPVDLNGLDSIDREVESNDIPRGSGLNESNETPVARGGAAPADLNATIESSSPHSRRSVGPVDIDEVNVDWDSEDEEHHSTAWTSDSQLQVETSGSQDQDDSKSGAGSSLSGFSKKVPRLKPNKRDTSPVKVRSTTRRRARGAHRLVTRSEPAQTQEEEEPTSPTGQSVAFTELIQSPPTPQRVTHKESKHEEQEYVSPPTPQREAHEVEEERHSKEILYQRHPSIAQLSGIKKKPERWQSPPPSPKRAIHGETMHEEDDVSPPPTPQREARKVEEERHSKEVLYQRHPSAAQLPGIKTKLKQWESSPPSPKRASRSVPMHDEDDVTPPPTPRREALNVEEERHSKERLYQRHPSTAKLTGVKTKLRQWESRSGVPETGDMQDNDFSDNSAEWQAFLEKKLLAESAAAAKQKANHMSKRETEGEKRAHAIEDHPTEAEKVSSVRVGAGTHDDDSLFDFNRSKISNRQRSDQSSTLAPSELSPVRSDDAGSGSDGPSSQYGPSGEDQRTFLQRLTECAAPMMSSSKLSKEGDSMPMAHLAFLRSGLHSSGSKEGSSRFVPPSLCGRPDNAQKVGDDGESVRSEILVSAMGQKGSSSSRPRAQSTPRPGSGTHERVVPSSSSSVVSADGFGAKTAYLEALAAKAAVSKPKRRRSRSSGGSVTSTSSAHSEKWKSFLDRKRASGISPAKSRTCGMSEVSKAAERYAAEKVEEMMTMMSERSSSVQRGRTKERELDAMMNEPSPRQKRGASKAAEDLAAARVEAMMAALSTSSQLDEGEI